MVYLLKIVMFYSYVKLPEDIYAVLFFPLCQPIEINQFAYVCLSFGVAFCIFQDELPHAT